MNDKTGLIRNAWYVAAWASEVCDAPYAAKIVGEPVVLYRKRDKSVVALSDICPHRFAPLHRGKVAGDTIECGYHGLRFDETGACVHNPVGEGHVPGRALVSSYRVVERDTLLWIWMGDSAQADAAGIPDFNWLNDPAFVKTGDRLMRQPIGYELIVDNLLDLSHAAFLHPTTLATEDFARGANTVRQDGNRIFYERWNPDNKASGLFTVSNVAKEGDRVDFWNDMRWDAPGSFFLEVGITRPGAPRSEGSFLGSVHLLTPESETSTVYRWSLFRNFARDRPEISQALEELVEFAFTKEDEPMLTAVQERMAGRNFWDMKPILLPADQAAVLARRTLQKLLENENPHTGFGGIRNA